MTELLGGLAFGVLGSAHCVAMCGPLVALAGRVPEAGPSTASGRVIAMLMYHLGRVGVYALLGAVVGVVGGSLAQAGFGRALAIAAGGLLLAQAFAALPVGRATAENDAVRPAVSSSARRPVGVSATVHPTRVGAGRVRPIAWGVGRSVTRWFTGQIVRVVGMASGWLRRRGKQGPLVLGALNGLLPCGLLYAALTAATGLGSLGGALTFMLAFGLGTLPLLGVVTLAADRLATRVPLRVRRAGPLALAVVGVLLIVRGVAVPHAQHGADAGHTQTHAHAR